MYYITLEKFLNNPPKNLEIMPAEPQTPLKVPKTNKGAWSKEIVSPNCTFKLYWVLYGFNGRL